MHWIKWILECDSSIPLGSIIYARHWEHFAWTFWLNNQRWREGEFCLCAFTYHDFVCQRLPEWYRDRDQFKTYWKLISESYITVLAILVIASCCRRICSNILTLALSLALSVGRFFGWLVKTSIAEYRHIYLYSRVHCAWRIGPLHLYFLYILSFKFTIHLLLFTYSHDKTIWKGLLFMPICYSEREHLHLLPLGLTTMNYSSSS